MQVFEKDFKSEMVLKINLPNLSFLRPSVPEIQQIRFTPRNFSGVANYKQNLKKLLQVPDSQ